MSDTPAPAPAPTLDGGAYEVIRKRLDKQGAELLDKLNKVNAERQAVFGAVEPALIASDRITTDNNCTPRDMVALPDGRFLFGYNVVMGLRKETKVSDVLSVYEYIRDEKVFKPADASFLNNTEFQEDFSYLYRYYKNTVL